MKRNLVHGVRLWLMPAVLCLASAASAHAQNVFGGWGSDFSASCGTCEPGCQTHHCPPALSHCQERPPCIRVKCGCPRPICNPCNQPGWGYYEKCWSPWPFAPNYGHCLTLPPAATIALSGPNNPTAPYYAPTNNQGGPPPIRTMPIAPSMPNYASPPVPTTPMPQMAPNPPMPRLVPQGIPNQNPMPQNYQPVPGGGLDSLPIPRSDVPPRPLPNPGGTY